MKKTKIEWCDMTWNPVTGCNRGCPYCYARRIAERFGGASETHNTEAGCEYCSNPPSRYIFGGRFNPVQVWIDGAALKFNNDENGDYDEKDIVCCPICGRGLGERV